MTRYRRLLESCVWGVALGTCCFRPCRVCGSGGGSGEGGMCPGWHWGGAAFWGAKIWNSEISTLLANWRLHCRSTVIFYTPKTLQHSPSFGTTPPTVSAPRLHTKQCVHQETHTADLTDHSPVVKLYRRSILSSYCLLAIAIQGFALHVFPNSV